ncbi:hypothetical protein Tco_1462157 [Tanacetum coccineum]
MPELALADVWQWLLPRDYLDQGRKREGIPHSPVVMLQAAKKSPENIQNKKTKLWAGTEIQWKVLLFLGK